MRYLVVLAALVLALASRPASAQTYTPPRYATNTEALAACERDWSTAMGYLQQVGHSYRGAESNHCTLSQPIPSQYGFSPMSGYACNVTETKDNNVYVGLVPCDQYNYQLNQQFKNGNSTWYAYAAVAEQCPGGYGTDRYGQCMDADKCKALNSTLGNPVRLTATPYQQCYNVGGCAFGPATGGKSEAEQMPNGTTVYRTTVAYSGASGGSCSTPQAPADDQKPDAPEKKESCTPAGAGQTYCVRQDGKRCASASNGKRFCWDVTETGTKSDGPDLQKRDAGNTPVSPNLQLPNGDTLQKKGDTITTSTTTTTNNTTTTTTTNISNYSTTNGTNATGTTDPKQSDGNTGDNTDKNGNSASGGGDCDSPPIVSGDAALAMVATQAWATRCAVDAGNAASVTGDVGDCSTPFTVQGNNANAVKLRAMRAQICPGEKGTAPDPSTYLGDTSGDQAAKDGVFGETKEYGTDGFDDTGLGFSRTCPTPPTFTIKGTTYTMDISKLCEWVALGGMFVLILAGMESLRVIGSGGSA